MRCLPIFWRRSRLALAVCALAATLPGVTRAQVTTLTERQWFPYAVLEGLPLLGNGQNWFNRADTFDRAAPDATNLGRFLGTSNEVHGLWHAGVDGLVTFGSLRVDRRRWTLDGVAGTNASLLLGNDGGHASLVVGMANDDAAINQLAPGLVVNQLTVMSSGVALVNHKALLSLDGTSWGHGGEMLIGASPAVQDPGSSVLALHNGSVLSGGLFNNLDLRIGSTMAAEAYAEQGSFIDAASLRVGAVAAGGLSHLGINLTSSLRVWSHTQIGDVGDGELVIGQAFGNQTGGASRWDASRVVVGSSGGGLGRLALRSGAQAVLGSDEIGSRGELQIGLFGGSRGLVSVDTGATLQVTGSMTVGGDGVGTATVRGNLQAQDLRVGGSSQGSGRLETFGQVVLGRPDSPWSSAVRLDQHGHWLHAGSGDVHGGIEMGAYGAGDVELRLASGATLQVHGTVSVGDYHVFDPQPAIDVRLVVESGAVLRFDGNPDTRDIYLYGNAELAGRGTVAGDVWVSGGTISPGESPGWLTIDGNLTFNANWGGGRLLIEIGGTRPGIDHDVLTVTGTLNLGSSATIELVLLEGFVPEAGQAYAFLRAGAVTGSFANIVDHTGLGLSWANGAFGINPAAAVPEPGTWALWLLGGAAIVGWKRRVSPARRACCGSAQPTPPAG